MTQDTKDSDPSGFPFATATEPPDEIPEREKKTVLWLSNVSHAVNHFQGGILSVMYPAIKEEFGIGETELGILNAVRHGLNSLIQGFYGFITPFLRKTRILALGNLIMALGVVLSGLAGSFWGFVGARSVVEIGSSPQHPVGASLLAGYFPKKRGFILSLNSSMASVGGFLAPIVGSLLVLSLGWRHTLVVLAGVSAVVGVGYLIFGRRVETVVPAKQSTGGGKISEGFKNYRMVLKNRNMLLVSLVMMVGAGGRGGGINDTFLVLHMVDDLGMTLFVAGLAKATQQGGGIIGPMGFGWLSDRLSRKRVLQASLILSALGSWWVAWQGESYLYIPLFISLFVYGVFSHSRMTQTQAIIADSVEEHERDAAFSAFFFIGFLSVPFWGIAVGVMMEYLGFSMAFTIVAFSYILGAVLMSFVEDKKPATAD
ncbi:MAG: MFS transporter [Chloroflexi bacterium]|nr:MFS transporter [Chloroflexota bacterium]